MEIAKTIDSARAIIAAARKADKRMGFVPTMGALHAGHASLIGRAVKDTDFVVVSIFVNPTQFAPTEDLDKYPRTFAADAELCEKHGVSLIFAPTVDEMYPPENITWVKVEKLTENLCGRFRGDHFRGVTTVCSKLFNIIQPDIAYFGQKDAQQAIVIKRMVADLHMPLKIVTCPIIRENDGLAMSTRNKYLTAEQRKNATLIYKSLQKCEKMVAGGQAETKILIAKIKKTLEQIPDSTIDYVNIVSTADLKDVSEVKHKVLVAVAVKVGSTRLIDNILLDG